MQDESLEECYRLLEVQPDTTLNEIREAFRVQSRVWHPDRFAGSPDMQARATARQQELNAAYQRLVRAHRAGAASDIPSRTRRAPSNDRMSRQPAAAASAGVADTAAAAVADDSAVEANANALAWARRPAGPAVLLGALALLSGAVVLAALGVVARAGVVRDAQGEAVRGVALAAGGAQACTAADSRIWCWGTSVAALAAGSAGGAAPDWGAEAVMVPVPDTVVALAGGLLHSCAMLDDGSVLCWGSNILGQLGSRGLEDRAEPARVAFDGAFAAISALGRHTCGLTADGTLYCWGDDADGQLGIGRPVASCRLGSLSFFCSDRPEQVGRAGQWQAISAGGGHTCAVDRAGGLHCWGSNRFGQLGGSAADRCAGPGSAAPCRRRPERVQLDEPVTAIATGASHTCALDAAGRALCWGLNAQWQTGTDAGRIVHEPTAVATELRFRSLVAGAYHTCGITAAGSLHCWGSDAKGELRGRAPDRCDGVPCAARTLRLATGVAEVAAGFGVTCSRRGDGIVRCWGEGGADRNAERIASGTMNLRVRAAGARQRLYALRNVVYRTVVQPIEQAL